MFVLRVGDALQHRGECGLSPCLGVRHPCSSVQTHQPHKNMTARQEGWPPLGADLAAPRTTPLAFRRSELVNRQTMRSK